MLKDKLEIHMAIDECNLFMQDGDPCHRSKLVSDFLKKNIRRLIGLDLNPIENLCAILKDKVADENTTGAKDLENAITSMDAKGYN